MLKASIYTIKGAKSGELTLPKNIFEEKVNLNLLAQAVHVYRERLHIGLRKTKTRAEVNRTTKKLYKQKGTGGARHGSRRAPIFVGGGVALGPRPIKRNLTLSQALRIKARNYAFSLKAGEKEIVVVSGFSKLVKTKEAADLVKKIKSLVPLKRSTFILSEEARPVTRLFRNIEGVKVVSYSQANAFDILEGGVLVLDKDIFAKEKPAKKTKEVVKVAKKTK